ncbi:hypothetical protein GW17_00027662 [Ensete ventricosum]|nr:hypothetical protein GW17_00027662 [Ensete ventricosum]
MGNRRLHTGSSEGGSCGGRSGRRGYGSCSSASRSCRFPSPATKKQGFILVIQTARDREEPTERRGRRRRGGGAYHRSCSRGLSGQTKKARGAHDGRASKLIDRAEPAHNKGEYFFTATRSTYQARIPALEADYRWVPLFIEKWETNVGLRCQLRSLLEVK